jgi:hypothetical protein
MIHIFAGRTAETRAGLDLATKLSPLDPLLGPMRSFHATSLLMDGDFEAAADGAVRAAQISNSHFVAIMFAVITCQLAGQAARTAHWMAVLRDRRPDARASYFLNALPYADPVFRATVLAAMKAAGIPD